MSLDCKHVAIIVTTFNPDVVVFKMNLDSYVDQAGLIVVCDNSEDVSVIESLSLLCSQHDNINYIGMGGNKGIACAQNAGVASAVSLGFDYFLEIDQDSKLPANYVLDIIASYYLLVSNNIPVAGIGPVAKSMIQDFIYHKNSVGDGVKFVEHTLSSGFFYSKSAFNLLGAKDESLFIDLVDWEWCWRAKKFGMVVAINTDLVLYHVLGNGHKKIFKFNVGLSSPIRLYYQYRNALYIFGRDYVRLGWKINRFAILILKIPFFLLFADRKFQRLKFIIKGVFDFMKGRTGRIDD